MSQELNFAQFSFGTQVRKSPYSDAALRWGAKGFSVYNHMYIPRDFGDPRQNFWYLVNDAILCDVSVERQVQIKGPDAAKFTQFLCCRDLSKCQVGQCKYVLITDQDGGIINDPILLKLAEDHFWLSIADSDVLLWARGVAVNSGMDVDISEPDVSPLQLQGPKSRDVLRAAFGDAPTELKYYRFMEFDWDGVPLIISRTGWSSELGYEIFLRDGTQGERLWEHLMAVGGPLGLKPGHTSSIRRIEAGIFDSGSDFDSSMTPFESGLENFIDLGKKGFMGRDALMVANSGVRILGLHCKDSTPQVSDLVLSDNAPVGKVTTGAFSPYLECGIGYVRFDKTSDWSGKILTLQSHKFGEVSCTIVDLPFYDQEKFLPRDLK